MRASRSPRRALPGFAFDMAKRDMRKKPDPLFAEMLLDLRRLTDHLAAWAEDHADEATSETWAALHCARETIAKAEAHHG
jgi:hypothetical protein